MNPNDAQSSGTVNQNSSQPSDQNVASLAKDMDNMNIASHTPKSPKKPAAFKVQSPIAKKKQKKSVSFSNIVEEIKGGRKTI